jgi:DMSO reductase anchor subunit
MMAPTTARPTRVDLIPSQRQQLWGFPAVVNFALGGVGAGFYVVAALASGIAPSAGGRAAWWLGPVLVLAGFAAVATEAGRPLRGPRVLLRIGSSWMSRELWLGGAFVALAVLDGIAPSPPARVAAVVAAAALVFAQGQILHAARGVAAWSVPVIPAAFLASSAVSGVGLLLLADVALDRPATGAALGTTLAVLVLGLLVWLAFITWSDEPAFARATAPLRSGPLAAELIGVGYVVPFALAAAALAGAPLADATAMLAGVGMVVGQFRAKSALILTAGTLRPIALDLTLRRTS